MRQIARREGLGDVLTTDALSATNARYLGAAVTLPVATELDAVLLNFTNALGMGP